MKQSVIIAILLVITVTQEKYARITDYNQYLTKWKQQVPQKFIHNVSHMALEGESCYNKKCQFYYYEYSQDKLDDPIFNRTILMVAGFHGNEYLGPHTLLYAYKHLKAAKIIYFPMANPSGFLKNQRQTYPIKIDPNRDFPIDKNSNCYQVTSTHIIDMLFRKYSFDLTVVLHNGGSQISFNWGTFTHVSNSHTSEYQIYQQIGEMLKYKGGESKSLNMNEFKMGTMDEVIYPASGSFDDWAYAAGKFPQIMTNCTNFIYKTYPEKMANGLVFLIEMGPFNSDMFGGQAGIALQPSSGDKSNGYISRLIRMLIQLIQIVQPTIQISWKNNEIGFIVHGCHQAVLKSFKIHKQIEIDNWMIIYKSQKEQILEGDIRSNKPRPNKIQIRQNQTTLKAQDTIKFQGLFHCDPAWQNKGSTFFSTQRIYPFTHIETLSVANKQQQQILKLSTIITDLLGPVSPLIELIIIIAISIIIIGVIYMILVRVGRAWRKEGKKGDKFEQVEHANNQQHKNHSQGDEGEGDSEFDLSADLHTARGGIIQM